MNVLHFTLMTEFFRLTDESVVTVLRYGSSSFMMCRLLVTEQLESLTRRKRSTGLSFRLQEQEAAVDLGRGRHQTLGSAKTKKSKTDPKNSSQANGTGSASTSDGLRSRVSRRDSLTLKGSLQRGSHGSVRVGESVVHDDPKDDGKKDGGDEPKQHPVVEEEDDEVCGGSGGCWLWRRRVSLERLGAWRG